jgi:hypothetical protein
MAMETETEVEVEVEAVVTMGMMEMAETVTEAVETVQTRR